MKVEKGERREAPKKDRRRGLVLPSTGSSTAVGESRQVLLPSQTQMHYNGTKTNKSSGSRSVSTDNSEARLLSEKPHAPSSERKQLRHGIGKDEDFARFMGEIKETFLSQHTHLWAAFAAATMKNEDRDAIAEDVQKQAKTKVSVSQKTVEKLGKIRSYLDKTYKTDTAPEFVVEKSDLVNDKKYAKRKLHGKKMPSKLEQPQERIMMTTRSSSRRQADEHQQPPSETNKKNNSANEEAAEDDAKESALLALSNEILLHILQHLSADDLAEFAMCSQRCRSVRDHESLASTRLGTIVITASAGNNGQRKSFIDLLNCIVNGEWSTSVFVGNRSSLRIDGLKNLDPQRCGIMAKQHIRRYIRANRGARLPGVKSLDISNDPLIMNNPATRGIDDNVLEILSLLFPNLQELDLSYVNSFIVWKIFVGLRHNCPNLTKITWNREDNDQVDFDHSGRVFVHLRALRELHIENAHFCRDGRRPEAFLLAEIAHRLTHLDIKGAQSYTILHGSKPLENDQIVQFVRNAPLLRWLRTSNLSEQSLAMLQQERPEIKFVSE